MRNNQIDLNAETSNLALCYDIKLRTGIIYYFTSYDVDIEINNKVYISKEGIQASAIQNKSGVTVSSMTLSGIISEDFTLDELRSGALKTARVRVFVVNIEDVIQETTLFTGFITDIRIKTNGEFIIELKSKTYVLQNNIGIITQPECRADLGDKLCKFPLMPPEIEANKIYKPGIFVHIIDSTRKNMYTGFSRYGHFVYEFKIEIITPSLEVLDTNTLSDFILTNLAPRPWFGTNFKVKDVRNRIEFEIEDTNFAPNFNIDEYFFRGGVVHWNTGFNTGTAIEVITYNTEGNNPVITTFHPTHASIEIGDEGTILAGCDKSLRACANKFSIPGSIFYSEEAEREMGRTRLLAKGNTRNFRGEPFLPGRDFAGAIASPLVDILDSITVRDIVQTDEPVPKIRPPNPRDDETDVR